MPVRTDGGCFWHRLPEAVESERAHFHLYGICGLAQMLQRITQTIFVHS